MTIKELSTSNKKTVAVILLILNLGIPGIGSIVGGKMNAGIGQLLLAALAGVFAYLDLPNALIGIVAVSAWLWALLTSIELLQVANKK